MVIKFEMLTKSSDCYTIRLNITATLWKISKNDFKFTPCYQQWMEGGRKVVERKLSWDQLSLHFFGETWRKRKKHGENQFSLFLLKCFHLNRGEIYKSQLQQAVFLIIPKAATISFTPLKFTNCLVKFSLSIVWPISLFVLFD